MGGRKWMPKDGNPITTNLHPMKNSNVPTHRHTWMYNPRLLEKTTVIDCQGLWEKRPTKNKLQQISIFCGGRDILGR